MDLLIVESLEAGLIDWLRRRHSVRHAPELARDPRQLSRALAEARAIIVPASVVIDERTLRRAPRLRAIGRITGGTENIDRAACAHAGVEVVRSTGGAARAEAEFMVGALLSMLRRIPVVTADGLRLGRELGGAAVGLVGLFPSARPLSRLLASFGATLFGYDPAVHGGDSVWARWQVEPLGLRELFERCDAVCVQLGYLDRYQGLIGEQVLPFCKPDQVLVSIGSSALFEAADLAHALGTGRLAAAWLDDVDPASMRPGEPLAGLENLQVTPRVAGTTVESRQRSARAVVERIGRLLDEESAAARETVRTATAPLPRPLPDEPAGPKADSPWR